MAMPKWHELMRPILVTLAANGTRTSKELSAYMVKEFKLTEEEQAERLNSGQLRMYNRMYWAITDLEKAKLLSYGDKRGTYAITDAGRDFLAIHSEPFTSKELMAECPTFKEWREASQPSEKSNAQLKGNDTAIDDETSPLESMQRADQVLRAALADELLQAVMKHDPYFFEHLVGSLLVAMGYGESLDSPMTVTRKTGDEGIDGIVKEDRLGFDNVYYQAKRWDLDRTVSRPDLQAFVGALSGKGAAKGLFITTASFSRGAREYAESLKSQRLVLVDGKALAGLMIDYGVGVSTVAIYPVKAIDSDFFADE